MSPPEDSRTRKRSANETQAEGSDLRAEGSDLRAPYSGAHYENICAKYLQKEGYRILERNYRTRLGEIDIIAKDGEDIVFFEVKGGKDFPPPFTRVTPFKLKKILLTVQHYLHQLPDKDYRHVRVDVLSVTLPDMQIRHFKDITAH
ncbi:MAG: YraN family protein [Thermotogaceae bacterium]|nr:YraN family protein [Thermotogaceae bacterium]